jgi:processive 1,2-diacylglycerol beta-glucosyltransferase
MKKILIVYGTAGIGHKKAAAAIKKAFDEMAPKDAQATLIDALDYAPPSFKEAYLQTYLIAVNRLSLLWGLMYYITDNFYVNLLVSKLRRLNNWLNSRQFVKYLLAMKPDVIIATHFFAIEVVSALKRKGILKSRLIGVVTDYRLHSWWVSDLVDTYTTYTERAKAALMCWNIPAERIKVLGIPVEPEFSRSPDREELRSRLGLKKGLFTALVIGGGFGVGPIEAIVRSIGGMSSVIQAVVICGHNEDLVERVKALSAGMRSDVRVTGFVDNVYDFMAASDVLISKSGGVTVSESLAEELPMIIISPIPGQETGNASFLIKEGAALRLDAPAEAGRMLDDLAAHPEKAALLKTAIRRIRKPDAAYDIVKLAMEDKDG